MKNVSLRRHSSAAGDSPVTPGHMIKKPVTVLTVKPLMSLTSDVTQSDTHNASLSSTTATTTTSDGHRLSEEEDEVDSTSRPQSPNDSDIQSTPQYFVSTSGNQPLHELPKLHRAARQVVSKLLIK